MALLNAKTVVWQGVWFVIHLFYVRRVLLDTTSQGQMRVQLAKAVQKAVQSAAPHQSALHATVVTSFELIILASNAPAWTTALNATVLPTACNAKQDSTPMEVCVLPVLRAV